jgi:putative membrane protein
MRAAWLLLGIGTLLGVWFLPLERAGMGPFSVHMTAHMGTVAIAAPLLTLAVMGSPLDPVRRWPRLFLPIPASLVELVIVWAWHAPTLHSAARHSSLALVIEQLAFFLSGMLVWLSALGGSRAAGDRTAAGILALLLTSMHMTLLGALLALAPRPLYPHAHGVSNAGPAPLDDQHLGGAIMLLVGGVAYLAGGVGLSVVLLGRRSPRPGGSRVPIARSAPGSSKARAGT